VADGPKVNRGMIEAMQHSLDNKAVGIVAAGSSGGSRPVAGHVHSRATARVFLSRTAMRAMLVDSARSLDSVPADEQVAVGLSLFYWKWENREGLPAQIVMHAPRKAAAIGQRRAGLHRIRRVLSMRKF
jgi:hypothetical protein